MDPNETQRLLQQAAQAATRAYCPYSGYAVGAALQAAGGEVMTGCNVENASYGLTICAERSALAAAVAGGLRRFKALAVVASGPDTPYPCGACRQVLAEFCPPDLPVYVACSRNPAVFEVITVGELLPKSFAFAGPTGDEETA